MESILYDSKKSQTYKFGLHILDFVPRDESQSIIDIGSGSGALTKELTHYAGSVIGVDKDIRVVERAKRKYPTVTFYAMDALRLQYENRFDVAFSNATFHEVEDKARLCESIFKCLKEGGKLITEFLASDSSREYFERLNETLKGYGVNNGIAYSLIDKRACKKLLEETGFVVEHLKHYRHKSTMRCDEGEMRENILETVSRDVPQDIREKVADDMMMFVNERYKVKGGYEKDIARLQVVATKPHTSKE